LDFLLNAFLSDIPQIPENIRLWSPPLGHRDNRNR